MQSLERRLERMVDGVFTSRARTSVKPIELGRRILREMDDQRTVDVKGRRMVPNAFEVRLSPTDHAGFAEIESALRAELIEAAREYARNEGYYFMGEVNVTLAVDNDMKPGRFEVASQLEQTPGVPMTASVVAASGERHALRNTAVRIGRASECELTLVDPNISRRHCEIRPKANRWALVDLGSTNGTLLNGAQVLSETVLNDGDIITLGDQNLRFEAS